MAWRTPCRRDRILRIICERIDIQHHFGIRRPGDSGSIPRESSPPSNPCRKNPFLETFHTRPLRACPYSWPIRRSRIFTDVLWVGSAQEKIRPSLPADSARWHQDIDPSNILVVSRGGTSEYNCAFKIADLGLSHFKKYTSSPGNNIDEDTFGTSAYGRSS